MTNRRLFQVCQMHHESDAHREIPHHALRGVKLKKISEDLKSKFLYMSLGKIGE